MKAWHFVSETLRDGSPVPADGEKLTHDGELAMCQSGLHASVRIIDALQYAPGSTICRVECGGDEIIEVDDKLVCRERTILWRVEGEELLRSFARQCALDVIHVWNGPDVVREYLETGDESKRAAAYAAAGSAARAAAARAAAWAAARAAAAMADALADAAAAAWAAARAAAARATAWAAAGAAARDAAWATSEWAAGANVRAAQNSRLEQMVRDARATADYRRQR